MKQIYLLATMVLMGLSFSSCNKEPEQKENLNKADVAITTRVVTTNSVGVTFTPNSNTASFEFAIGQSDDLVAFDDGSLEGIIKVNNGEVMEHTFEGLTADTEYVIFVIAIDADGAKSSVLTKKAKTAPYADMSEITISTGDITTESIAVTFTPNSTTASYEFAIGQSDDLTAFDDGTLEGIIKVNNGEVMEHTFEGLTADTEYTIFVSGVNINDLKSETTTITASTSFYTPGISVVFDNITIPVAEATFTPNEFCENYFIMYASKEIWYSMLIEGTYEEKLETLALYSEYGMTTEYAGVATDQFVLNGYADYEYVMLVLSYDAKGRSAYQEIDFMSPSLDTTLPLPSPVQVTTISVTETSATLSFTPGDNTIGFYYALFTKENYEATYAEGEVLEGLTGEKHIKEYTAFYGSVSLEPLTETWEDQPSGTDFVMVAVPFNANGSEHIYGFGVSTLHLFSTPGNASGSPKGIKAVQTIGNNNAQKIALRKKLIGI